MEKNGPTRFRIGLISLVFTKTRSLGNSKHIIYHNAFKKINMDRQDKKAELLLFYVFYPVHPVYPC